MTSKYLKVEISAETKENADEILNSLLMITFTPFDGNAERIKWVEETVG